ncbi:GM22206 [Drosophila sechellia]|uniref:GD15804 n=2 Tax=melanogaster subgroup TaxID=32351 RepID=B4R570_DROSI|nr:GM22206 [Drosophila sechellia]EDX17971.1 GD15804 [Drosophila simulans]
MTMSMYSTTDKMKMSAPSCFPGRYSPSYRSSEQMRRCMPNPSIHISSSCDSLESRLLEDASLLCNSWSARQNGDIFAGINDGILSRAEALAAVDIQKHQAQHVHSQMPSQIKHDVMYHHHSMSGPPQRPLQDLYVFVFFMAKTIEDTKDGDFSVWGELQRKRKGQRRHETDTDTDTDTDIAHTPGGTASFSSSPPANSSKQLHATAH